VTLADALEAGNRPPRVLTLDIEVSPNVAYAWGLWDQNISTTQLIEPSRVLCFAAKWIDARKPVFYSEHHDGRPAMVEAAWDLLNEADIVVGYNHVRYDIPHLQREFVQAGLLPPSPWQNVDLLKVNRSAFKWPSNRLGYVTDALGLDTKLDTGGQELWNRVLAGDAKAWAKFKKYNIQDVVITEQLFVLLSPWVKGPHRGLWEKNLKGCHACARKRLRPDGCVYTKTRIYPRAQCRDCGAWNRILPNGQTRPA
jgi:DNA polymerase elongation subunit (family B)